MKGFNATQSFHRCKIFGFGEKKSQNRKFLKGIKRQNRFIDSFLEEQRIGVALTDSFFLNRAHQWLRGRWVANQGDGWLRGRWVANQGDGWLRGMQMGG